MSDEKAAGTELKRTLMEDVFYPPHDPRKASPEYVKTHHHLVVVMDEPCWICGVRNSDVQKMSPADRKLWQLETHHFEIEWAMEAAYEGTDPAAKEMLEKFTADHMEVMDDPARLREYLDSEGNMLILCATHHRGSRTGIHSITHPAWKSQRFQVAGGWQFIVQPEKPTST